MLRLLSKSLQVSTEERLKNGKVGRIHPPETANVTTIHPIGVISVVLKTDRPPLQILPMAIKSITN